MKDKDFVKGCDGQYYFIPCWSDAKPVVPFSHSKELVERESSDYYPYSYIEDDEEPLSIDNASLVDWDWE